MAPGGFEYESYALLRKRGHALERLDRDAIRARFPAWSTGAFVDGYYNPAGGWVESGQVVSRHIERARAAGVKLRAGVRVAAVGEGGAVAEDGEALRADHVVLAAGSWSHHVMPELATQIRSVGQPVFHLRPRDPSLFAGERFPVFGADIARTGYYGFPINESGIVKIANHGVGRAMHPESDERVVIEAEIAGLRAFLRDTFPALQDAPIEFTRVCVYGDTPDEHFLISPHPANPKLVVAAGGSGHGFKFAPVLGDLIADAVEGRVVAKFRWRPETAATAHREEASRHHASSGAR
jgi:glycine/D-amino acid oxidase-like deaminating enzyme